jgi:peptidylprolyl isomerase
MKPSFLCSIFVSAAVQISVAQTAPKPAAPAKAASASTSTVAPWIKLPPGVPRGRGVVKVAFALRYQDIKLGTGADAEPNKLYKVLYTGWLAADGHKFDSSEDHRLPLKDKDGKPVMGDDGKPKLGDVQPISFPQGFGRVIPGFDQGFTGMKVGGKRRLFIPWQLAYGARGRPGPDPAHPGIPPKADLIFDIELVDVAEMQMPPNHPGAMPVRPGMTIPPGHLPLNGPPSGAPGAATKPGQPAVPPAQTAPSGTPPASSSPATPSTSTPPPASSKPTTPNQPTPPTTQPQSQPQSK